MPRIFRALGVGFCLAAILSCSNNILQSFADKNSDAALYQSAVTSLNNSDFNGALTSIGLMSATYAATTPVIELKASAYGGICGLQFVPFAYSLSQLGSARLLPFLLNHFDLSSTTAVTNCQLAETTLLTLSAPISNDDSFFLATIEMAKIGQILSENADSLHSGTAASGYDPCTLSDADTSQIAIGINRAVTSINAVASVIPTAAAAVAPINTACAALGPGSFCTVTDPTAFTATQLNQVRSLVKENAVVGLGSNCSGNVTLCHCP